MFKLFVDLFSLVFIAAFELRVEELEVREVEAVLFLEVYALHFFVALDQLGLDVHGLPGLRHCLTRFQLTQTT